MLNDNRENDIIAAIGFTSWAAIISDMIKHSLEWVILVGSAVLVAGRVKNMTVRAIICRKRDRVGPCNACKHYGRWLCPGPKQYDGKHELVENQYD